MENGAWTDGLNFGNKMCLSIVGSRAENSAVYPFNYVLCKHLFSLFWAFVGKVGELVYWEFKAVVWADNGVAGGLSGDRKLASPKRGSQNSHGGDRKSSEKVFNLKW